jgi:hypothetical protein
MSDVTAAAPAHQPPPTLDDIAAGFEAELNAEQGIEPEAKPEQAEPTPHPEQEPDHDGGEFEDEETEELSASEDEEASQDSEADQDEPSSDPEEDNATDDNSFLPGMSEDERAQFAKLPAELKSWVGTREASRQADYTRKTQAIAEQSRELNQSVQQTLERMHRYDAVLATFAEKELKPPPKSLEFEDPLRYDELSREYVEGVEAREAATKEREQLNREREQYQAFAHQQWIAEQESLLVQAEPMFADPERGPKLRDELFDYAEQQGFDSHAIKGMSAKEAQILLKAKRYDDAIARRKSAPAPKAKPPKTATPGVSRVGRPTKAAAAIRNLRENPNPSRDDLARAYEAELEAER